MRRLYLFAGIICAIIWAGNLLAAILGKHESFSLDLLWIPPFLFVVIAGGIAAYVKIRFRFLLHRIITKTGGRIIRKASSPCRRLRYRRQP
jgi:hypothetical protein